MITRLPVQRNGQGIAVSPGWQGSLIGQNGAIDGNGDLRAAARGKGMLLTDAVVVGAGGVDGEPVGNVPAAVAQITGNAVAVGAAIDTHGEAGGTTGRGTARHRQVAVAAVQLGIQRSVPGRALATEIQQARIIASSPSADGATGDLTAGTDNQLGLDMPADRCLRTVDQQAGKAENRPCALEVFHGSIPPGFRTVYKQGPGLRLRRTAGLQGPEQGTTPKP